MGYVGTPARTITGQEIQDEGTITASIQIGNTVVTHKFHVVDHIHRPVLLGWDFLRQHKATLDIAAANLNIFGQNIPLWTAQTHAPLCSDASIAASVTLVPNFEMNITAIVGHNHRTSQPDFIGIFEPSLAHEHPIHFARTLGECHHGLITVRVINPTSAAITLPSNYKIGQFFALSDQPGAEFDIVSDISAESINDFSEIETLTKLSFDLSQSNISPDQKLPVENLLRSFHDVFSVASDDYGRTNLLRHHIRTGDASPVNSRAYRTSPRLKLEITKEINKLLAKDVIQESSSPWASPIVMVRKKDGSYRFCVDYRKLNAITVKDAHPLPRTDDSLDALAGSALFTTLDLCSGYWQVEMSEDDCEKTAFTTGDSLYEFKVMPMGLASGPATFQRLMGLVLRGLHWSKVLVYLDDIIVIGSNFSEHLENLKEVLSRFRLAGLKVRPDKCQFFSKEVRFLGHVVSNQGVMPDPGNVQKILDWTTPQNASQVRSFLGLCSYYRRFVCNYAQEAEPLHRLTCKNVPFIWTDKCEQAFQFFKLTLTNPPVLANPDFERPFILFTDASSVAIGTILAQKHDGKEHVISYASRVLSNNEIKWSTYDRDCMGHPSFQTLFE